MTIYKFFKKHGIIELRHVNYNVKVFCIYFNVKKFPDYYKLKYELYDCYEISLFYNETNNFSLVCMSIKRPIIIRDLYDFFEEIHTDLKLVRDVYRFPISGTTSFWLTKHGRIKEKTTN
jgi:hypothetical protein